MSAFTATISAVIILAALLILGWLLRKKMSLNLGLFFSFFALLVAAFTWTTLQYYTPLIKNPGGALFYRWYLAIIVFLGVWYMIKIFSRGFWDMYLVKYREMQVPALVRNLVTLLLLIATILIIIRFVFSKPLSGLLVASSVTAAVIAFALQDFLGGLISGIALSIKPPFEVGDWIEVLDTEGTIVDIDWRATTLITRDKTHLIVPNNLITKEKIINYNKPTRLHDLEIKVGVEYGAPPTRVKKILLDCANETRGIRSSPAPRCHLLRFAESEVEYEIECCIDDRSRKKAIRDNILSQIWYNFRRNDIDLPFPTRTVYMQDRVDQEASIQQKKQKKERYLREADIFEPLEDGDIQLLLDTSSHWFFGRGEAIVRQSEQGSSLFLILEGHVEVHVDMPEKGERIQVGDLQAGDFFGEKSLLTGEARSATVRAQSDVEVAEIEKQDLAPILENNPFIVEQLSDQLADRQLVNEGYFEEARDQKDLEEARADYSQQFLHGIQSFFGL